MGLTLQSFSKREIWRNVLIICASQGQYIFVHNALEEYVTCGSTDFPVSDLPERLRILNTVDPDSGDSLVVAEFKVRSVSVMHPRNGEKLRLRFYRRRCVVALFSLSGMKWLLIK